MAIYAPDRRINPTVQRKGGSARKGVYAGLALTSMVDMFAIMVVFLLQTFSAEGELIVLPKDFELPEVLNTGTLSRAPVLTIARDKIEFEGKFIANTAEVAEQEGWVIPKLQEEMKAFQTKALQEFEQKKAFGQVAADAKPDRAVNISADKRLQFQVVKKIIYNASFAGFPDFRFAVFGKSKIDSEAQPQ